MTIPLDAELSIANIVRGSLYQLNKEDYSNPRKKAIYLKLRFRSDFYDENRDNDKSAFNMIHMIFEGHVSVWVAVNDKLFLRDVEFDEFENTSNHDSCWALDGFRPLINTYFNQCEEVQSHLPEHLRIAPKDVRTLNTIDKLDFIEIEYKINQDGRKELTNIIS
ncbi:MAG: hypothetical protein ACOCRK_07905 [bacterium]